MTSTTMGLKKSSGSVFRDADRLRALFPPVFLGALLLYLVMLVFFSVASDNFLTVGNSRMLLTQVAVLAIVSLGQLLVILSGGFDLSVAGVIPLACVLYVQLSNASIPTPLSMLIVLFGMAIYGAFNGILVTKLSVSPLVATLATMSIGQGLAFTITNGLTVPLQNAASAFLSQVRPAGVPLFVIVFIGIAIVLYVILRHTVYGRAIYSCGGSREAARLAGINESRVIASTYSLSATLAGVAGIVLASQLLAGSPTVGSETALTSIAAVVLGGAALSGGVGGVMGTFVGVLIIGTLTNGMALLEVPTFYQLIATGLVLLLAVIIGQVRVKKAKPRWLRNRTVKS